MTTLGEAMNEFQLVCKADGFSPATVNWYRWILSKSEKALGTTAVEDMTKHNLRAYVAGLHDSNLAHQSVISHISALHRFWSWCADEYKIENPMATIKRPKRGQLQPKTVDPVDFIRLFDETENSIYPERDRALLALLADTGVRRGGLETLKIEDIDDVGRRAIVTEKGSKTRWIYWTHYTDRLLDKWLEVRQAKHTDNVFTSVNTGGALTGNGLYQITKRLKKRAGITGDVYPHAFRHNFARMYLLHGGDIVTLARLLGHNDVNVTAAYYAVFSSDELAEMQAKHSPLLQMMLEVAS